MTTIKAIGAAYGSGQKERSCFSRSKKAREENSEARKLWKKIRIVDSLNLIEVKSTLQEEFITRVLLR
jgi:hypothetical protein